MTVRAPASASSPPSDRRVSDEPRAPDAPAGPDTPGRKKHWAPADEAAPTPQAAAQRGVVAARTLDEVKNGVEARAMRVHERNRDIASLEAKLGTQLANLSPALTRKERQQYAETFRAQHAHEYGEARESAEELGRYLRDNLPRVQQTLPDLAHHPHRNAVAGLPGRFNVALEQSAGVLERYTQLAPKGSPELQHALGELGQRFAQLAPAAGHGSPGTTNRRDHNGNPVKTVAVTSEGVFERLAKLGGRFSEIAEHSANAFGVVAGAIGGVENLHRLASGEARAEHAVGLAANGAEIVGGALAIGGVAVGATLGLGGAIVALGAEGVSAYRDRQEYLRDTTANLRGVGLGEQHAEWLAASNPEALRALASAGFTARQISELSAVAPGVVKVHDSHADAVAQAARQFSLSPEQVVDLARRLGFPAADAAFHSLVRVISANPKATRPEILAMMNQGFDANEHARALARLLPAS